MAFLCSLYDMKFLLICQSSCLPTSVCSRHGYTKRQISQFPSSICLFSQLQPCPAANVVYVKRGEGLLERKWYEQQQKMKEIRMHLFSIWRKLTRQRQHSQPNKHNVRNLHMQANEIDLQLMKITPFLLKALSLSFCYLTETRLLELLK